MLKIPWRSLTIACLLFGIVLQPAALLAEGAAQPASKLAPIAPAAKAGCPGGCPECAACQAQAGGSAAPQDCPCKHAKRARKGAAKAKRKTQAQPQTQP